MTSPVVVTRDCGRFQWDVRFQLENPAAADGYIVQQLDYSLEVRSCTTGNVIQSANVRFWEAWWVPRGHRDPSTQKSHHSASDFPRSRGTIAGHGLVRFFEIATVGSSFIFSNPALPAHNSLASAIRPAFWNGDGATVHSLTLAWNCCERPHTHRLTTDPATPEVRLGAVVTPTSKIVASLIESVPPWSDEYDSAALRRAARRVLSFDIDEVRAGVASYASSHETSVEDMSKIYLLLRVLFELPRTIPIQEAQSFAGWLNHPNVGSTREAYELRWPVVEDERGELVVPIGPSAYVGRPYAALRELDFFESKFPLRREVR